MGFVPQGREIFARLTVEENLRMGLAYKPAGTPIPAELFELFPVLQQMLHRRGGDLSGGQQQQLAIARALAAGPKVLILDEPTEGIQPSIIKDIGRVIRMLADRGDMAILLVEQYYDFAQELADNYIVMERGAVLARGMGQNMEVDGVRGLRGHLNAWQQFFCRWQRGGQWRVRSVCRFPDATRLPVRKARPTGLALLLAQGRAVDQGPAIAP